MVRIDPFYFRPTEVDNLLGNAQKAKDILGWSATTSLQDIICEMVRCDLAQKKERSMKVLLTGGTRNMVRRSDIEMAKHLLRSGLLKLQLAKDWI